MEIKKTSFYGESGIEASFQEIHDLLCPQYPNRSYYAYLFPGTRDVHSGFIEALKDPEFIRCAFLVLKSKDASMSLTKGDVQLAAQEYLTN